MNAATDLHRLKRLLFHARRFRLHLAIGFLSLPPSWATAEDWPQFRGPNCSGISTSARSLPANFSPSENLAWKADVGDGVGGVVVAAGRAFVSGMTSDEIVSLFAFDVATGKQIWRRDFGTGPLAELHATNSQASSTPAADEERVYFYFSTLGLMAIDAKTGFDVWEVRLPTPFFVFKWGPGMSPILDGESVLFVQDDDLHPAFYSFDRKTGRLNWKDDRLDMAVNYSHPVICSTDSGDEIVVGGTGMLIGYNPQNGARKWSAKVLLRNLKTTPVVQGDVIYVSVQSGGIANQWIVSVDRDADAGNNDGRLDREEIQKFVGRDKVPPSFFERTFGRGDTNRDGYLEGEELDRAFLHPDNFAGADHQAMGDSAAEQFILAVRAGGHGDVTASHLLWKHSTKHTDHIVSPLLRNDRLLLLKSGGITTVYSAADGSLLRKAKRVGQGGDYFASPVVGDGKIFLAGENGDVVVLRDDASYSTLARNEIGESIVATPAIADGTLFVRSRTHVMAFRN